ncbi:MAG: protein rep [Lentisphaeria bacterium]|nr:protein rep [Lentisphaeria bacterium]
MSEPLSKLRNSLLRVSQGILAAPDFRKRHVFKRFFKCQNTPYVGDQIEISYSAEHKSAHYGNIIHCGSVWLCPDCSAKISAVRCGEMQTAISNWTHMDAQNAVYMLTLTHSHTRHDALSDLMANQSEALQRFWRNGSVRRLLDSIGYAGRVSSFEITYGQGTGWHPHRHILLFCRKQSDLIGLGCKLRAYWTESLEKFDLRGNSYSLDLQGGAYADQYVTKLAMEVSLSNLKRSRDGSERFTPFSLLNLIKESLPSVLSWAVNAFREYAVATRGKHQFSWSRGLKVILGIEDIADEEIAETEPLDSVVLLTIPFSVFKRIRRSFQAFHGLLDLAARTRNPVLLDEWLRGGEYYVDA